MPKSETGVYRRAGSNVWQWRIKTPKELLHAYENKLWAFTCSLHTSDLVQANIQGSALRAQWLEKFAQQGRDYERVQSLSPEHGRTIADEALRVLLRDEKWRVNQRAENSYFCPLKR